MRPMRSLSLSDLDRLALDVQLDGIATIPNPGIICEFSRVCNARGFGIIFEQKGGIWYCVRDDAYDLIQEMEEE